MSTGIIQTITRYVPATQVEAILPKKISREALIEALRPLEQIADRYDNNQLEECRPEWKNLNDGEVELFRSATGETLLTLEMCKVAQAVLKQLTCSL